MTKIIRFCLYGLLVPLLFVSGAAAMEDDDQSVTTEGSTGSQTTISSDKVQQIETETKDKTKTEERIKQRVTDLNVKLNSTEERRVKDRCKNAQTAVKTLSNRVKGTETSRNEIYQNLRDRLDNLVTKLNTQNVDTAALTQQITVLEQKITTFKTDLASYKQALSDLENMDCQADPTGFKASLEAARKQRENLNNLIKDIRTYVQDTIKPTLQTIRDQLNTQESADNTTNTEQQ